MATKTTPSSDRPNIGLNLDTLEREEHPEPFQFTLAGRRWFGYDPEDADWRDMLGLSWTDLDRVVKLVLADQYEEFAKIGLPLWKLQRLVEAIRAHFSGMPLPEGNASPAS